MFSYTSETMSKMAENNPLLAMMKDAMATDGGQIKKSADAWLKMMPAAPLPSQAIATGAAMSAVGVGLYSQWLGTMYGAMTNAAKFADSSSAAKPVMFNPLSFEWSTVEPSAAPKKSAPKKSKPKAEMKPEVAPVAEVSAPAPAIEEKVSEAAASVAAASEVAATLKPAAAEVTPATAEKVDVASATEFSKPKAMPKPEVADDLKLISGVGPKLEKVLNGLGVWTFAQIAEWTPAQIAWVDDFLQFSGRIERDEWIKQAAALAKGGREEYVKVFGKEPV